MFASLIEFLNFHDQKGKNVTYKSKIFHFFTINLGFLVNFNDYILTLYNRNYVSSNTRIEDFLFSNAVFRITRLSLLVSLIRFLGRMYFLNIQSF